MAEEVRVPQNEKEADLIRRTFTGNEALLKSLRALFLGLETTKEERDSIRTTFSSAELRQIMWDRFAPTLSRDTPIGQVADVWLGVESMIFSQSRDTIYQAVIYKQKAIDMTRMALSLLENPEGVPPDIEYHPSASTDDLQTNLLARNQFIRHIEQQLLYLKLIAEQTTAPTPTVSTQNSTK